MEDKEKVTLSDKLRSGDLKNVVSDVLSRAKLQFNLTEGDTHARVRFKPKEGRDERKRVIETLEHEMHIARLDREVGFGWIGEQTAEEKGEETWKMAWFRQTGNSTSLDVPSLGRVEQMEEFTHNHPLLGTLSPGDVLSAMTQGFGSIRATRGDGVWVLEIPEEEAKLQRYDGPDNERIGWMYGRKTILEDRWNSAEKDLTALVGKGDLQGKIKNAVWDLWVEKWNAGVNKEKVQSMKAGQGGAGQLVNMIDTEVLLGNVIGLMAVAEQRKWSFKWVGAKELDPLQSVIAEIRKNIVQKEAWNIGDKSMMPVQKTAPELKKAREEKKQNLQKKDSY
ncbi:MAG: hypothetical protein K2Q15_07520 [Burkholderiales bacterium]|nr:hypothetical protein [Burkholderiales bacterium]